MRNHRFPKFSDLERYGNWLVLVPVILGAIGTTVVLEKSEEAATEIATQAIERRTSEIASELKNALQDAQQLLRDAEGLFNVKQQVSHRDWKVYVDTVGFEKNYPGIQALAFSRYFRKAEMQRVVSETRAQGFPDFKVFPDHDRDEYTSIVFIEPFNFRNQRAFGFDMMTEAVRGKAMRLAMESGTTVLSGIVKLKQETEQDVQPGFLLYHPVYKESQGIKSLLGFAYSPIRARNFATAALRHLDTSELQVQLFDGSEERGADSFFEINNDTALQARYQRSERLELLSHNWILKVSSLPAFERRYTGTNLLATFVLGAVITLFLSVLVWTLVNARKRALALAAVMSKDSDLKTAKYRAILSAASDGLHVLDLNGNVIEVNEKFCEMLGYSYDEVLRLNVTDWDAQFTKQEVALKLAEIERHVGIFETVHRRKDGLTFAVEVSANIMMFDGQTFVFCSARDISQRKATDERLRVLSLAVEQSSASVVVTDHEAKIQYVNDQFCKNTGFTREEVYGRNPRVLQSRKTPPERFIELWQHLSNGRAWRGEFTNRRKNGELYIEESYVAPVVDLNGRTTHFVAVKNDVTELRNTERILRESEAKYRVLFGSLPIGALHVDANGWIVDANSTAQEIFQLLPNEQTKYRVRDLAWMMVRSDQSPMSPREIENLFHLRGKQPILQVELGVKKSSGAITWISANLSPLEGGVILSFQEITHRKNAEKVLEDAKKGAENAAQIKAEFLANMSHEIRTPMNGVIGLAKLALNEPTSAEVRDYLLKISSSSETLLGILNDILDFSKLEAGRMHVERRPFRISQLLSDIVNLFEIRARAKDLEFRVEISPDVPSALIGDSLRIQQVLANLIGNAIKFTERGSVTLKLEGNKLSENESRIKFTVADTGIGMASEVLNRVFNPFVQADSSIGRRFGGTGLGLAISKNLLKLMNTEFTVTSLPGKGSTFSFELVLGVADYKESQRIQAGNIPAAGGLTVALQAHAMNLKGKRILVAEDDLVNQVVIKKYLSLAKLEVKVVANGEEVLSALRQQDFDIVLMDVHMPVMDGIEATGQLRRDPKHKNLPVIALTAGVTESERARCLESGMNDFIAKPFEQNALFAALERWSQKGDFDAVSH